MTEKTCSLACHSERGAPRSESEINMLAGGKHTSIQRSESKNPYLFWEFEGMRVLRLAALAQDDGLKVEGRFICMSF